MFTLKDFTNLSCINNSKVMTAKEKIDNIPVEHIAVIELPVEDFIRNNELVLTTAIGCHDDPELFMDFVKNVYLSKATGLVLAAKDEDFKIPEEIITYCESIGFPIIIIPWKCRFSEIIEGVLNRIGESNKEKNEFLNIIQKELLSAYLNSMDLSFAAGILSKYLKAPIVIVDADFNVKEISKDIDPNSLEIISLQRKYQRLANIQVKDNLYGYLLAASENESLSFDTSDFEYYLAMPISLWFEKENIIDSTKLRLASDFIWNLALDKFDSQESLRTKARLMGFDIKKPYTCMVGRLYYMENMSQPFLDRRYIPSSRMNNIMTQIQLLEQTFDRSIMISYHDDSIIIYLENKEYDKLKNIHIFLDVVDNKLEVIDPLLRCSWGISEIKYKQPDFHRYYLNAELALKLSQKKDNYNSRSTYEDSNIFKILTILSKEGEIMEIAHSLLDDLLSYDKSKKSNLLITLRTYIKNNYNVSKTARELHLHRQSLLYRLDKIQELTHSTLDNHESLFLLEICTRLHFDNELQNF